VDRDGHFLASVSPRHFFCTECHVPQNVATPPVTNDFLEVDILLMFRCAMSPGPPLKQSKSKAAASRKADGQSERPPERSVQSDYPRLLFQRLSIS
jgi:hypothetical protein